MSSFTIITSHEKWWETDSFPLCAIDIPAVKLAEKLKVPLAHWEEDGLGDAYGFAVRLPSGLVVLTQELVHAVLHRGQKGPSLYVDASQFVAKGPSALVEEVMAAFKLSLSNFTWIQTMEAVDGAHRICNATEAYRKRHPPAG